MGPYRLEFSNLPVITLPIMKEYQKKVVKETGRLIRMTRLEKGLTVPELAMKSNVSAATILKIEKGESNFRMTTFFRIGEALEVNFSTLVGDDEIILKQLLDFDPIIKVNRSQ